MLHLYESLFRAGYGEQPERFLSKDELDDYRASLSYYNSQYLELLAMLNTEQSVLFKKLQDNRSDIIGLERDASFRCGLCVGLKLGSLLLFCSNQCGERSNAAISQAVCRQAHVTRASR